MTLLADADEPLEQETSRPTTFRLGRWLNSLRTIRGAVTLLFMVLITTQVVASLQPQTWFLDTTPTGGDMGAHVWAASYLRESLLPNFQLTGWSQDWYAGLPALHFYWLPPMLLIAVLSYVIPFGVAFKLVTVLGLVTMPLSGYVFGRLNRLPFPTPLLLALACGLFVFDRSFTILGGNAPSSLAGEFSFSISLSLAILYLGLVGRGLREGTYRVSAAVCLALTTLCHGIPAMWAVGGAALWFVVWFARDVLDVVGSRQPERADLFLRSNAARLWWLVSSSSLALLLAAFHLVPFLAKSRYMNHMGWEPEKLHLDYLFWRETGAASDYPSIQMALALGLIGVVVSFSLRNRVGVFLTVLTVLSAMLFVHSPEEFRVWNARFIPFYNLSLYLLGAVGIGLLPALLLLRRRRREVAGVALVCTATVQIVTFLRPKSIRLPWPLPTMENIDWGTVDTATADRYEVYPIIGVAVVTLVLVVELLDASRLQRRILSWLVLGAEAAVLTAWNLWDEGQSMLRLTPWFIGLSIVTFVVLLLAALDLEVPIRRRLSWAVIGLGAMAVLQEQIDPELWVADSERRLILALVCGSFSAALAELLSAIWPGERAEPSGVFLHLGWQMVVALVLVPVGFLYMALPLQKLGPFGVTASDGSYQFGLAIGDVDLVPIPAASTAASSFIPGWAEWNYAGLESYCTDSPLPEDGGQEQFDPSLYVDARGCQNSPNPSDGPYNKKYWPEYHALIDTMDEIGRTRGCGRAMWEHTNDYSNYGTPMVLMLLPHWTEGCIASMEGVYFESSGTTPFHFINQDEFSRDASNPQRGVPYPSPGRGPDADELDLGIDHLMMHGVKYYIAYTQELIDLARANADLTEIAQSPSMCSDPFCPVAAPGLADIDARPDRFVVFELPEAPLVEPLVNQPLVLTGISDRYTCESNPDPPEGTDVEDRADYQCYGFLEPTMEWYLRPELWDTYLTEDGPDEWARMKVEDWMANPEVDPIPVDPVVVSNIESGQDWMSFSVDQVGSPVLVKMSYFPNWSVSGAEGPYRVSPSLMVVIPTETEVRLDYELMAIDRIAYAMTLIGFVLAVVLWRRIPLVMPDGPNALWREPSPAQADEFGLPRTGPDRYPEFDGSGG